MTLSRKRNLGSIIDKEVPESSVPMSKLCWKEEEKALCQCILKDTTVYICSSKIVFSSPLSQWKQERPFDYYAVQCKICTQTSMKSSFTSVQRTFKSNNLETFSKCRICFFQFWHFPLQLTCLVTLFDLKLEVFKNVECDFLGNFQTMCRHLFRQALLTF